MLRKKDPVPGSRKFGHSFLYLDVQLEVSKWHTDLMRDMNECREEDAENWRRLYGPWHADEIREWFEQTSQELTQ